MAQKQQYEFDFSLSNYEQKRMNLKQVLNLYFQTPSLADTEQFLAGEKFADALLKTLPRRTGDG